MLCCYWAQLVLANILSGIPNISYDTQNTKGISSCNATAVASFQGKDREPVTQNVQWGTCACLYHTVVSSAVTQDWVLLWDCKGTGRSDTDPPPPPTARKSVCHNRLEPPHTNVEVKIQAYYIFWNARQYFLGGGAIYLNPTPRRDI